MFRIHCHSFLNLCTIPCCVYHGRNDICMYDDNLWRLTSCSSFYYGFSLTRVCNFTAFVGIVFFATKREHNCFFGFSDFATNAFVVPIGVVLTDFEYLFISIAEIPLMTSRASISCRIIVKISSIDPISSDVLRATYNVISPLYSSY